MKYSLDEAVDRLRAARRVRVVYGARRWWIGGPGQLSEFSDLESARAAYLALRRHGRGSDRTQRRISEK